MTPNEKWHGRNPLFGQLPLELSDNLRSINPWWSGDPAPPLPDFRRWPGTAGGAQAAPGGFDDAFVARVNASLTALGQATYLGGSADDEAAGMAIHAVTGEVYATGRTFGSFPGTAGGAQATFGGSEDAFVARLTADLAAPAQPTPTPTPTSTPIAPTPTPTPVPGVPSDIPTLSPWMLALLAVALGSIALLLMRRGS